MGGQLSEPNGQFHDCDLAPVDCMEGQVGEEEPPVGFEPTT